MITYSAPGKVILSGEHSVVFGKPALVTAINLRFEFSIFKYSEIQKVDKKIDKAVKYCDEIVRKYLAKNKIKNSVEKYSYLIKSEIPRGRGMGSSAAFCVATVAGLLHWYSGKQHDKQMINSLAYQCEKYFHGMPSGVDVSGSCFGGLIYYRKEFEFLKNISSLNFKIPKNIEDKLFLIDSGTPAESTAEMVKIVGLKFNNNPKIIEQILAEIEKCTKRMVVAIVKEDSKLFSDTISENQNLLDKLGIVSVATTKLIRSLQKSGVGKVTGAGGAKNWSGMVLFLGKSKNITNAVNKIIKFKQDFEGVKFLN